MRLSAVGAVALGIVASLLSVAEARPVSLAVFGDGPASGDGMPERFGFAERLQNSLSEKGYDVTVKDFADSGETTEEALRRIRSYRLDPFDAVILAFGAADQAEGLSPARALANLRQMLEEIKRKSPRVAILLADTGGEEESGDLSYETEFSETVLSIARQYDVSYYPDFMKGVSAKKRYLSENGEIPNAEGYIEIVTRLLPATEALLHGAQTASSE